MVKGYMEEQLHQGLRTVPFPVRLGRWGRKEALERVWRESIKEVIRQQSPRDPGGIGLTLRMERGEKRWRVGDMLAETYQVTESKCGLT